MWIHASPPVPPGARMLVDALLKFSLGALAGVYVSQNYVLPDVRHAAKGAYDMAVKMEESLRSGR